MLLLDFGACWDPAFLVTVKPLEALFLNPFAVSSLNKQI